VPAEAVLVLPVIQGQPPKTTAPADADGWTSAIYEFDETETLDEIELVAGGLDLLGRQTAVASVCVVRNATIGGGGTPGDGGARRAVNDALVYRTPDTSFPNVIVPLVEVMQPLTAEAGVPLRDAMIQVLQPLARAATALHGTRVVRIAAAYVYPIVEGTELCARLPVLLNAGQTLEGDDPVSIARAVATPLAAAMEAWQASVDVPRGGAYVALSISLFIQPPGSPQQMPVLSIADVRLPIAV
jgi:hypothetical protein